MGSTETLVHQLSPVDHLSPRIHVPKLLYFASEASPDAIVESLREGLTKSIAALPILGGTVELLQGAKQKGTLAIQAPFCTAKDILSVRDVRNEYAFDHIKSRHFPPDAINIDAFTSDTGANPSRVLLAQENIIRGGVVLVLAIHYCVVDETGIFDVVTLWSTFCSGKDGSSLVKPEWTNRTAFIKGEGTGRLSDHPEFNLLPEEKSATRAAKATEYISKASASSSVIFFFSDEPLAQLKNAAGKERNEDWISTNDALCALVWSRVTKARSKVGMGDATYSMFNMVVNGRSRMDPPVPEECMGNVVFVSKAFLPLEPLVSGLGLSEIASTIRKSVLEVDNPLIKDKIHAVSLVDDIGRLAPGGYNSFQRHLDCTSWANQGYYSLEWGNTLGGRYERVRWRKIISDGIFVIFPRIPPGFGSEGNCGGLEVYLGLHQEHLDYLRTDHIFNQYAQWRHS